MPTLSFIVPGVAKPQGSKSAYQRGGRIVMVEAVKGTKEWRAIVVEHAWEAIQAQAWIVPDKETPVTLNVVFQFVRPPSSKRVEPTVKPDLDKLVRNIADGCTTAGVWRDDAQATTIVAKKTYGENAGCFIEITYA